MARRRWWIDQKGRQRRCSFEKVTSIQDISHWLRHPRRKTAQRSAGSNPCGAASRNFVACRAPCFVGKCERHGGASEDFFAPFAPSSALEWKSERGSSSNDNPKRDKRSSRSHRALPTFAGNAARGASPHSRGSISPGSCTFVALSEVEGAGKAGCRRHPQAPCATGSKKRTRV